MEMSRLPKLESPLAPSFIERDIMEEGWPNLVFGVSFRQINGTVKRTEENLPPNQPLGFPRSPSYAPLILLLESLHKDSVNPS